MGSNLSVCGLQARDDPPLHYQRTDFVRTYEPPTSTRGRSVSSTTDSSVASILSNSERLVPDIYMPQDIQVLSQRRQRLHTASRSSCGYSGKDSSMGSSRVSNFSSRGLKSIRAVRHTPVGDIPLSVSKRFNFGIKTASSSFGYSDDEVTAPTVVPSDCMERLSVQPFRVK